MPSATRSRRKGRRASKKRWWRPVIRWSVLIALGAYAAIFLSLLLFRWVDPPFTAVQAQRRVQAMLHSTSYQKEYVPVPLHSISVNLQHAVIAAEDTHFYQHHGFDWKQMETAAEEDLTEGRTRGASTITQQLVKNLFLTTGGSFIRKGFEFAIVPAAELLLSKQRILELYLNVIEWGPGTYGAEAASHRYYSETATALTRDQSIQLASVLPAPLRRKPGQFRRYGARIEERMREMKW